MSKTKLFNKGDVILTNPEEGFWGIAIVLSEREKTENFYPMCHIAITSVIVQHEIDFNELINVDLKPIEFERNYNLKNRESFSKTETCIGVYTRRNKENFKIIGSINPNVIYNGPLPFDPIYGLEITWPIYGDADKYLGREAYINWKRQNPS